MALACVVGCLAERAAHRCIAGSPARRRGNFLLRGQKKVTKEEALNRTPASLAHAAQDNGQTAAGTTRTAALSPLSLSPAPSCAPAARLPRGCTPCSRENPIQRRSGDAIRATSFVGWGERSEPQRPSTGGIAFAFADEPGVQPALTGLNVRSAVLVTGTAARAQRLASARNNAERFRAPLPASSHRLAVQGLFFGDFLLAPQKKVTPPPGGTPGNATSSRALR
jgi:hypothetical protein